MIINKPTKCKTIYLIPNKNQFQNEYVDLHKSEQNFLVRHQLARISTGTHWNLFFDF